MTSFTYISKQYFYYNNFYHLNMLYLVFLIAIFSLSEAFLLDFSTPSQLEAGNVMTDNRYDTLLKIFTDERNVRMLLQQNVLNQQQQISDLKVRLEKVEKGCNSNIILPQAQETDHSAVKDKLFQLTEKYKALMLRQRQLEKELADSKNISKDLHKEVVSFKQTANCQNLSLIQSLQNEVIFLNASNQARDQRLLTMDNEMTGSRQRLTLLESKQNSQITKLISIEKNQTLMAMNMTAFESQQNSMLMNMTSLIGQKTVLDSEQKLLKTKMETLERKQNSTVTSMASLENDQDSKIMALTRKTSSLSSTQQKLSSQIHHAMQQITSDEEYVAFTAIGIGRGTKPNGTVLRFPIIKSSFGISNLSSFQNTGTFTCEKKGLYLIVVSVVSCTTDQPAAISLFKNNIYLIQYYIEYTADSTRKCHSGSGSTVVALTRNETLNIKTVLNMEVYEKYSSLTILKVK